MTNGIEDSKSVVGNDSIAVLKNQERRLELLRRAFLERYNDVISSNIRTGSLAHAHLGKAVDDIIDEVINNAKLDGLDIDGDFLNVLEQVSANLYSIEVMWKKTHDILKSN